MQLPLIINDPLANFHSLETNPIVVRIAAATRLTVLPQHFHEILLFAAFYFSVFILSSLIMPKIFKGYKELSPRTQHGFDNHVVSSFNAVIMCAISLPLFWCPQLSSLTSYTPYAGMVVAHNIGYFVWDLWVTIFYYKYNGLSFLAHAATAFFTFSQAMCPFLLNYAAPFIWFEASTPFVNLNWFAGHIPGLISPKVKQYNGIALILAFLIWRIIPGPINGYKLFKEALANPPQSVPTYSVYGVLLSYFVLSALNFVWFSKMLKILVRTVRQMKAKQE